MIMDRDRVRVRVNDMITVRVSDMVRKGLGLGLG